MDSSPFTLFSIPRAHLKARFGRDAGFALVIDADVAVVDELAALVDLAADVDAHRAEADRGYCEGLDAEVVLRSVLEGDAGACAYADAKLDAAREPPVVEAELAAEAADFIEGRPDADQAAGVAFSDRVVL